MFRTEIIVDAKSYVELASRKSGERDLLALTMRGEGSAGQPTLASVSLTKEEVVDLRAKLADWLDSVGNQ